MTNKKTVDPKEETQATNEAPGHAPDATAPVLKGYCPRCGADSDYPRFDLKHKDGCSGKPI